MAKCFLVSLEYKQLDPSAVPIATKPGAVYLPSIPRFRLLFALAILLADWAKGRPKPA